MNLQECVTDKYINRSIKAMKVSDKDLTEYSTGELSSLNKELRKTVEAGFLALAFIYFGLIFSLFLLFLPGIGFIYFINIIIFGFLSLCVAPFGWICNAVQLVQLIDTELILKERAKK